jgi:hypothetical protein
MFKMTDLRHVSLSTFGICIDIMVKQMCDTVSCEDLVLNSVCPHNYDDNDDDDDDNNNNNNNNNTALST